MQKEPTRPIYCWAIDLDLTTTIHHTFPGQGEKTLYNSKRAYHLDQITVLKNVKNVDWYREFFTRRAQQGDIVIIVTAHNDKHHVETYMLYIFGMSYKNVIKDIQCVAKEHPSGRPVKNVAIEESLHRLGCQIEQFGKNNVVLIDDGEKYILGAKKEGFQAVTVKLDEVNKDAYIKDIEAIQAKRLSLSPPTISYPFFMATQQLNKPILLADNAEKLSHSENLPKIVAGFYSPR
jgi:hypothetical protein